MVNQLVRSNIYAFISFIFFIYCMQGIMCVKYLPAWECQSFHFIADWLNGITSWYKYEGSSEINASYFMMLAHDIGGGCWWYGSRGRTFRADILLNFVAMRQMTAEGQSDKMASDMEMWMKHRCVTEFLHAEQIAPSDIHRRLLNVYGDQTVDVSTVRRWVARFSSGDSDVKDKPRSGNK